MTVDEAIKRITEHMIIHKINESQAILITEALCMAIEALEKSKWKSVKDELPKDEKEVLVKLVPNGYKDNKIFSYSVASYIKSRNDWDDRKIGFLGSNYRIIGWKEI